MSWISDWFKNDDGSESKVKEVSAKESKSGNAETHYLSTAGGGSKSNHTHVVIQHREGRNTAHCVPKKEDRKG